MDLQIRILEGAGGEDYWILVARGALTEGSLKETLHKLGEIMSTHSARKFLVDLQYTTMNRQGGFNIDEVLSGSEDLPLHRCRIIFVCPMGSGHYAALQDLCVRLSARGGRAAVFTEAKRAADWLALQVIPK